MRRCTLALGLGMFLAASSGCSGGSGNPDATLTLTGTSTVTGGPDAGSGATTPATSTATSTRTTTGSTATSTRTTTTTTSSSSSTTTVSSTATGTGTGRCNYPECATKLFTGCTIEGCGGGCVTEQGMLCGATACAQPPTSEPTAVYSNTCHGNGVKTLNTVDIKAETSVTTVKKNGRVCYSIEMPYSSGTTTGITMILKNGSGATVGTYVIDTKDKTATITCTGGSPVVVPLDCVSSSTSSTSCPACTTGTCTR